MTNYVERLRHSKIEAFAVELSSKFEMGGRIRGAQSSSDVMVNVGRHTTRIGLDHMYTRPKIGYRPALGLIQLFNRTGTCHRNPKMQSCSTTPSKQQTTHCHSYAEVMRSGMDWSRQFGCGTGNRSRGNGTGGFCGQAQG
jgi:hypothetical protein